MAFCNVSILSDLGQCLAMPRFGPSHALHSAMPSGRAKRNKDADEQLARGAFRWISRDSSTAIPKLEEGKNERKKGKKGQQTFEPGKETGSREATQEARIRTAGIYDSEDE